MNRRPVSEHVTAWDRAAVVALGAAGCALSYSALQQMAVAIHVRPALCWLFPLAIDGFISYGVRALLVLRAAPLRARLYVWTLFGTATAVSVWANALHAVRLNQGPTSVTALRLGDQAVAALSTVAPLALAGAVHLYILIARGPDGPAAHGLSGESDTAAAVRTGVFGRGGVRQPAGADRIGHHRGTSVPSGRRVSDPPQHPAPAPDTPGQRSRTLTDPTTPAAEVHGPPTVTEVSGGPRTPGDRRRGQDTDRLLAIARQAVLTEDKLTRKVIAQAIRGQGVPLSNDTLTHLMARLRQQYEPPDTVSG